MTGINHTNEKQRLIMEPPINQHITCPLCHDFLTDAVTLTGCLHFFCRVCLFQRRSSTTSNVQCCPICFTKFDSESGYRRDKKLQELVYKLVPDLFWRQLRRVARRRRHNQNNRFHGTTSSSAISDNSNSLSSVGILPSKHQKREQKLLQLSMEVCSQNENISLQLDYVPLSIVLLANETKEMNTETEQKKQFRGKNQTTPVEVFAAEALLSLTNSSISRIPHKQLENPTWQYKLDQQQQLMQHSFRRFYRCRANVQIGVLKRLLETKLAMTDTYGVYFVDEELHNVLEDDYTLADLVQMCNWSRETPLRLYFTLVRLPQDEEDRPPLLEEMPQLDLEVNGSTQMVLMDGQQQTTMEQPAAELQQHLWLTDAQMASVIPTTINSMLIPTEQQQISGELQQNATNMLATTENKIIEYKTKMDGDNQLQQKHNENSDKKSTKQQHNATIVSNVTPSTLTSARCPFPPTSSLLAGSTMPSSKICPSSNTASPLPPPSIRHRLSAAGASPLSPIRPPNYHQQPNDSVVFSSAAPPFEQESLTLTSAIASKKRQRSLTTANKGIITAANTADNNQLRVEKKLKLMPLMSTQHKQQEKLDQTNKMKIETLNATKMNKIEQNAIQQKQSRNNEIHQNVLHTTSTASPSNDMSTQQKHELVPMPSLASSVATCHNTITSENLTLKTSTSTISPAHLLKKPQRRNKLNEHKKLQKTTIPSTSLPPSCSSTTHPSVFTMLSQFPIAVQQQAPQQPSGSISTYPTLFQNILQQQKANEAATFNFNAFASMFQLSPQQLQQGMQQMFMQMAAAGGRILPIQQPPPLTQQSSVTTVLSTKEINRTTLKNHKNPHMQTQSNQGRTTINPITIQKKLTNGNSSRQTQQQIMIESDANVAKNIKSSSVIKKTTTRTTSTNRNKTSKNNNTVDNSKAMPVDNSTLVASTVNSYISSAPSAIPSSNKMMIIRNPLPHSIQQPQLIAALPKSATMSSG